MTLRIINAGMQSLVVDEGRKRGQSLGYCESGPLDRVSFVWALKLNRQYNCKAKQQAKLDGKGLDSIGEYPHRSCIEVLLGNIEIVFHCATTVVITGGKADVYIDDVPINMWTQYKVLPKQHLRIGQCYSGMRQYIACGRGFNLPRTQQSITIVKREGLGGINNDGEYLSSNDILHLISEESLLTEYYQYSLLPHQIPTFNKHLTLRVSLGYQYREFDHVQRALFFNHTYKLTDKADRMGLRFDGRIIRTALQNMYSEGITLGAIQIPPNGQPIIMLADRQTIGGYPKIGSVISADIHQLGQLRPGNSVNFELVDMYTAREILLRQIDSEDRTLLSSNTVGTQRN